GMPLGIELAAAWLKTLPCARIADEIQHNLDFLASPLRNVSERHRSMHAVFDHSWKLLTPEEQAVFQTLSVFRGGFEHEAAEQVADATLPALTALVDKSLLHCSTSGRYDLHELLRQYAEEQLEAAGESANAWAAHSAYYMHFLAQRDADVKGRRQMAAVHDITTDFENIRAAWLWAQDHRHYNAISRAINCLINFADMASSLPNVLSLLQQTAVVLAPAEGETPHPVWEQVVVRREWANYHLHSTVDHVAVETILGRATERGDQEEVAWCLWVLADYAHLSNNQAHMVAIAEKNLALRRTLGDEFYVAHALIGLSGAHEYERHPERALDCVQESIFIRRRVGDIQGLCFSLIGMGNLEFLHGNLMETETYVDQAIALQEAHGKSEPYLFLVTIKAVLAFWRGELEAATRLLALGPDPIGDYGNLGIVSRSLALAVLSCVHSLAGNYAQGRQLCEQAPATNDISINITVNWSRVLANCGLANDTAALQSLRTCLRFAVHDVNSRTWQLLCLPLAAILSARNGEPHRAVELLGLTSTAPQGLMGWQEKWPLLDDLKAQLKAELGTEAYESAWQHGQTMDLDKVVAQLLGTPEIAHPERDQKHSQALADPLSERELEVLRFIADGLSNAEIAQKLYLSVGTVKVHTRNIYGKLGVNSRTQAIVLAQKLRLIAGSETP
ncbi:MAG: LuxR C-terminal-related transcriptional regulator, partial [Aggregatilineales bacterium]